VQIGQRALDEKGLEDFLEVQYLQNDMVRSYIRFIDRLVSRGNKKLKMILFYCVAEESEDTFKIFKQAEKSLSTDNMQLLSSNRNAHKETISFLFHLMIEFW